MNDDLMTQAITAGVQAALAVLQSAETPRPAIPEVPPLLDEVARGQGGDVPAGSSPPVPPRRGPPPLTAADMAEVREKIAAVPVPARPATPPVPADVPRKLDPEPAMLGLNIQLAGVPGTSGVPLSPFTRPWEVICSLALSHGYPLRSFDDLAKYNRVRTNLRLHPLAIQQVGSSRYKSRFR